VSPARCYSHSNAILQSIVIYTPREDLQLMALQPQAGVSKQVQNKALIASLMGSSIEW
jgi:hypothetical protein